MTRAVLPTPATPSYCAAMTVGTMVKRFAHVRFLVDCLWVQLLFTLSVPRDIFRTPALIWGRFIDSGNQVGRTRSDIQAAGPRRCQSQIVLLLLGCKAGLISLTLYCLGPCATARTCNQPSSTSPKHQMLPQVHEDATVTVNWALRRALYSGLVQETVTCHIHV